jgi:hypothetical protein
MTPCIGNDPYCPCQDGDSCHYRDIPGSPGWPLPTVNRRRAMSEFRPTLCCDTHELAWAAGFFDGAD